MHIAELFRSLQGEGRLTGTPSIFVRLSGCNLRCRFCDTRYASWEPDGEHLSIEQVVARIQALAAPTPESVQGVGHVVITGGEPMIAPELVALCDAIHGLKMHITIETAATRYLPVACDLMSISPKLVNSTPTPEEGAEWISHHERNRYAPEVIERSNAEYDCQFKFVIDRIEDCREVMAYLADFPQISRSRVMLMPQGIDAEELAAKALWLEPYCLEHGLAFCPRRQIEWFGPGRGV